MKYSGIQWTDVTHNFWHGCLKVSDGCKFCYMHREKARYGQDPSIIKVAPKAKFNEPRNWKGNLKVFTCSWSDFFIAEADHARPDAWEVIRDTPNLTWQILTKRPERILDHLPADWGDGYPNVWLGVTIENQKAMDRLNILAKVPAHCRFVSFEPLLGPIDVLTDGRERPNRRIIKHVDWAILGGESGNETGKYRYRPCEQEWMEDLIVQLDTYSGCAVFVKQLGTCLSRKLANGSRHGDNFDQFSATLQRREFPVLTTSASAIII